MDDAQLDQIMANGETDQLFQKAIEQQGRGQALQVGHGQGPHTP